MNKFLGFAISLILLAGCGEIFEVDISDKEVILLAPGDGVSVQGDSVSLWWESLDGARTYQVQLVSPSFDEPELVYLDSVTSANLLILALDPGDYEWQVRALNAGYNTDYFYRSFTLDSVSYLDISGETIDMIAPQDGAIINSTNLTIWWELITGASSYEVRLASPDFSNADFVMDSSVTDNKIKVSLDQGMYECKIRAKNPSFETQFVDLTFEIDTLE